MEWIINSYDRRTDRDAENRFDTEAAFISAADELLHKNGPGSTLQLFLTAQSSETNGRCGC
jgi:hypothetical protein